MSALIDMVAHPSARRDGGRGKKPADPSEDTAGYDLGAAEDDRPVIDCTAGRRDRVVDASIATFGAHPAVYVRNGQLVRVVRADKLTQQDRLRTDADRLLISGCSAEWASTELARRVQFQKWDRRGRKFVACDPPSWTAPAMLADGEFDGVRPLAGVTSAPVLRPDGSVWSAPGYDKATGMLLAARGALPSIPATPTERDAAAALTRLRVLLSGYVWGDEFSEPVALSLILTKLGRHLTDTAPLFTFTSPTAGSGKTEVARAASIIADGVEPSLCTWPGDDEEMRKAISSALLAGQSFVVFDNVPNGKTMRSASLDRTLTAAIIGDRLLGRSESLRLVNGATWCATGNNIAPAADMVRRVIVARIDPRTERPWERRFDWTPTAYAREHRSELLAAALTILAAHLRANREPLAAPLQSFEAWSRIVRDALLWLGMPDAVRSQDAIADEDPDAEDRAELIGALREQFGTVQFSAEEVAQVMRRAPLASDGSTLGRLDAAISARINGKPATAMRIGHVLRSVKDQVSNRTALRGRIDGHTKVMRWQVKDVE